jgi:hypothetical protein
MAIYESTPSIVTNGLVLALDAANQKSYVSGSNTWIDLSGNSNTNTLFSSPTFSNTFNGGLVLNGTSQYATASDSTSLRPASFSIDVWFRPTSFNLYSCILAKPFNGPTWTPPYLSYMIRLGSTGTILECSTSTGGTYRSLTPNYTFVANTIYNVIFTFNSSTGAAVAYLNGAVLSSGNLTAGSISYSTPPLIIGAGYGASPLGEYFPGSIYSVKIYNTILSASEVTQNYNAQKNRFNLG